VKEINPRAGGIEKKEERQPDNLELPWPMPPTMIITILPEDSMHLCIGKRVQLNETAFWSTPAPARCSILKAASA
jgi:hypothetical protein